jgi:two-component system, chemotaxis family, sensor kinase CheA
LTEKFDLESLLGEFRDEARDQVDRLDAALLQLERAGDLDEETRSELLRSLHTLKGNAGMLGLGAIRDFVHVLEAALKGGRQEWSGPAVERLFQATAALRRAVEAAGGTDAEAAFRELTAARRQLEELEWPTAPGAEDAGPAVDAVAAGAGEERIRVPFAKLDALLSEVGELMAETDALIRAVANDPRAVAVDRAAAIHRRAGRLGDTAMALRLVPLGRVFTRFHGLVRRLAREQGKEARLVVVGESTEVDKSTADALAEPLLHLVRNAIDHGIEAPQARRAAARPEHGTIRIVARQEGDRVSIAVEDDGAGLDLEAIRARAREQGLVAEGEAVTDAESFELIFRPGLTTRAEASAISGRGVGLDVVRRSVRALRGEVSVGRSSEGGTRFVLRLPLTVASVPSVVFEAAGETMAVPSVAVDRTILLDRVERVGATDVVRDGERLVAVVDADGLFGWPASERGPFGLLVRSGRDRVVVAATRVVEHRDLVVKAVPPYGDRPLGVSGASVVPGGRVILLLDPAEVIELVGSRMPEPAA